MPNYIYTIRNKDGKIDTGNLEASDQDELVTKLQEKEYIVISVIEAKQMPQLTKISYGRMHRGARIEDLTLFARQLAVLLDAGITLVRSLNVLSQQIESRRLKIALVDIIRNIESGLTFHKSLAQYPKVFSDIWINLIETGEASGQLPFVLNQLADYLDMIGTLKRSVISALIYPLIVTTVAIGAILIFITFLIPIFEGLFLGFGMELPFLTRIVISISDSFRRGMPLFILFTIIIGYLFYRYIKTDKGRFNLDRLILRIPIFGSFFQNISISRFASGLSVLIRSGVPILYGLTIVGRTTGNKLVEKALEVVKENIRAGGEMAKPLSVSGVFPPMVVQMISVGEETGELGRMLERISSFYKDRVDIFVSRLSSIIEPLVIVVLGLIVGVIVTSMFLPIFTRATFGGI